MKTMALSRLRRLGVALVLAALSAGCGSLFSKAKPAPAVYALDRSPVEAAAAKPDPSRLSSAAPTLIVNQAHAVSGFDSPRMIYVRHAHQLEYFSHSEWNDTPARMLGPLLIAALERVPALRAVVPTPSAAVGDLRLDVEIIRLQHDFRSAPSRVQFTLRAYIVDTATRRLLGRREFDLSVEAASDDAYGGVVAANRVVQQVLAQLASFSGEIAERWSLSTREARQRPPA